MMTIVLQVVFLLKVIKPTHGVFVFFILYYFIYDLAVNIENSGHHFNIDLDDYNIRLNNVDKTILNTANMSHGKTFSKCYAINEMNEVIR